MKYLRLRIEQMIEDIENEIEIGYNSERQQGKYEALNEIVDLINEIGENDDE
jgi:hypothetical protein